MIISIGLITSVSATDFNESDMINEDANDVISETIIDDVKMESSNDSEVLKTEFNPVDFNEIQNSIDIANEGDTIVLNGNYVFSKTINVNKALIIRGINNAVVDGNSKVGLFTVTNDGVIFKNITFKNGYSSEGSAIDGKCNAINCTFINNAAYGDGIYHYNPYGPSSHYMGWGGAIDEANATGCIFINNSAENNGGAIYKGYANECIFINNTAKNNGGAIYSGPYYNGNIMGCIFFNNSAEGNGGAIYGGKAINCSFTHNIAQNGGALYNEHGYEPIQDCSFNNNYALNNGNEFFLNASNVYGPLIVLNIINCNFTNCVSNNSWFVGFNKYKFSVVSISNCNFINCTSKGNGGAISFLNVKYSVNNCYFEGNSGVNGGAIYYDSYLESLDNCYFKNNHAQYGGAIFYKVKKDILDCSFENNSANIEGNDVYLNNIDANLINCNFTNCVSDKNCWFIGFNQLTSISINKCNFINCFSRGDGGAIFLVNLNKCDIKDCYFEGNSGVNGGALYLKNIQILNITNCEFDSNAVSSNKAVYGNSAYEYSSDGGAIYLDNVTTGNIFNCTFDGNDAFNGGAICLNESCSLIDNCLFKNNNAFYSVSVGYVRSPKGDGGAVLIKGNKNVKVNNSIFANNCAQYSVGGAIIGNCNVFNSNFTGNLAMAGGAINDAKAVNCTFDNNRVWAYAAGGAIRNGEALNCTFIKNEASSGGAIYNSTAVNCSFICNHATYGGAVYDGPVINCNFVNNTANLGGAIYYQNNGEASNCSFINNSATDVGGAVNIKSNFECNIENCEFINCSSVNEGAAINCVNANAVNVIGCSFENCNSGNNGSYLSSNGETEMNISNCIFDEVPEGVSFKYDPLLTVNNLSMIKGEKAVLIVNLSDVRGQIANKNITFTVNGKKYYNITNSDGIAAFNIYEYVSDVGYYNVTVAFEGDEHVNQVSTYSNVFINEFKGTLSVSVEGKYYDDVTLSFKLIDSKTNEAINNASVKVEFDNGEFADLKTDNNGIATYKVPFAPGKYLVTAYVSDDNVDVNSTSTTFEINKIVGKVTVSQVDNNILDIRLFNSNNGDVYRNINVTLKFDNMEPIYVVTNEKGIATYQLDFAPGSYSLVALVSKQYTEIQNVLETIEIADPSNFYSKVTFSSGIVFDYGSSGSIYVTVTGGSIDEENIKVLNHPEAKITLVKNVITISKLNPGTYTLFVGSIPSGDLKPGNGTVSVTVKKSIAVVKASKVTVALKSKAYWVIKIVDSKTNKPISNMKVTLKIYTGKKYKSVTRYTNSKGEVNYNTKRLSKGNHKVVVSASHKGYNLNTFTSSIKVIKQTSLKFKLREKHDDNGGSLRSFVVTNKKTKKGVNGVKIKVYIYTGKKVKTYTLKTKKIKGKKGTYNGAFGFSTNQFSAGKHKVVLKPVSIKYKGSITTSIKIKKKATKGPKYFRTL